MTRFAWAALVFAAWGLLEMFTGAAVGECELLVLIGLVLAVLHLGLVLAGPAVREERAAQRLAR